MNPQGEVIELGRHVRTAAKLPAFSFAFQPIVDTVACRVHAYEALIRGACNEPASQVLGSVGVDTLHRFDDDARVKAIGLAARLGARCSLNLNFLPRSIEDPDSRLPELLEAAAMHGFESNRIVLEVTEGEVIDNYKCFADHINVYRSKGMRVAIDDFGAGYSGLNLLANFQPDELKLDMQLIRGIEGHGPRQAIVRAIVQACVDLGIDVIAEGVETEDEFRWFDDEGVTLFQGYYFARPGFESLPAPYYPCTRPQRWRSCALRSLRRGDDNPATWLCEEDRQAGVPSSTLACKPSRRHFALRLHDAQTN